MSMMYTTAGLRNDDVESYWREVVCKTYVPLECHFDRSDRFDATISAVALGRTQLTHVVSGASRYVRTNREIRQADSDDFLICLITGGEKRFRQSGSEASIGPGGLCIIDTGKPYELDCPHSYEATLLKVPRQELVARLPSVERIAAMRVTPQGRYAQLAATMLKSTADLFEQNKMEMTFRLVTPLVDLVALAFDESYSFAELDHSRYKRVIDRAQEVLLAHLTDPDFDVSVIPSMIGVSTRTLSRAFAQCGTTPSRWLWQRRLDAARDLLANSCRTSVSEVAMSCGFNDISHFSRAFRRRFDAPPSSFLSK